MILVWIENIAGGLCIADGKFTVQWKIAPKQRLVRKENPFGPFCYLLLWHLYSVTETLN